MDTAAHTVTGTFLRGGDYAVAATSTTVMVLEEPVPSWSQTTEWSTFQGNALHTGAIAATAAGSDAGATYALDIASHRLVWRYPAAGLLAMSASGVLYIAGSDKLTAVAVR